MFRTGDRVRKISARPERGTVLGMCDQHEPPLVKVAFDDGPTACMHARALVAESVTLIDNVAAPSHYRAGLYECRDVIAALGLDFDRGSAMKYLWRAGRKSGADELTDLQKAAECIQHAIKRLTEAGQ